MHTYEGIYGFVSADPILTRNDDGEARLYIRMGVNHYRRGPGRQRVRIAPTYHDLVQFGESAERSAERFRKGDAFVAVGYVREYERIIDGRPQKDEQFVAYRLSHDGTSMDYEVTRSPVSVERDLVEPHAEPQGQPAPTATRQPTQPPPPPPTPADDLTR